MKKLLIYTLVLAGFTISAQNLSYDFYAFRLGNMFNVNPAFCAKTDGINIVLNAQSQSKGVNYANKNIMAGAYAKLGNSQGLGIKIISDTRGAFQMLKADLSYAYIAKLNQYHLLTFGVAAGINNSSLIQNRIDGFQYIDQADPTLLNTYFNTTQFSAGAGVLYNWKNLDVSVSLPHIITTTQPFNSYLNTAAFYKFNINTNFTVQPWVSYQNIPVTKDVGGLFCKGIFKNMLWLQAGYQTNKSFQAAFGTNVDNIGLSYGFKSSNKDFKVIAGGIHEIMMTVKINKKAKSSNDNVVSQDNANSLDNIISNLDKLLSKETTSKEELKSELAKIKQQLKNAEIDNSDPEKAKKVEQQLLEIDAKLKQLEKRMNDAK